MSNLTTLLDGDVESIVIPAVEQTRRVTLTHDGPRGWRMFSAQFSPPVVPMQSLSLKLRIPPGIVGGTLPKPGDTLGITFRTGQRKAVFGTRLESLTVRGTVGDARIQWPTRIDQLLRRVCERAVPPVGRIVPVRLLREREATGMPVRVQRVRHGQLEDLSVAGLSVRTAYADEFQPGSTYLCMFEPLPKAAHLELLALVCHREAMAKEHASVGLQFVGLEMSAAGRSRLELLANAVSAFHRPGSQLAKER